MDARSYFEGVRAAQRGIDRRLAVMESMRQREQVRAQRYDAVGKGAGRADFMGATDDRIDYEGRCRGEIAGLRRYCEDRSVQEVSGLLGVSVRSVTADLASALDWVSMVGVARARTGYGRAAV